MEHINELYDLCDVVSRKIAEANSKIRKGGGELSGGDVEYIDKLTHTLKSLKTTIAMMEAEDDGGWSSANGMYPQGGMRGGQTRTRNMGTRGSSYARGRGRNAKRDSMGRYSRHDASEHIVRKLEDLMREAEDGEVREAISEAIETISMD